MSTYKIDIAASAATSNLTNFAARVSTLSVGTTINAAIFAADSGSGADVWFSSDAAGASPIDAKLIYWSDADSEMAFDVEVASISSTTGATIYLHVGSKPGSYGTNPYDASTTGSWPLIGDFLDDTETANGTGGGGVTAGGGTGPDGVLPATVFDGTDDIVQVTSTIFSNATAYTAECWLNAGSLAPAGGSERYRNILSKDNGGGTTGPLILRLDTTSDKLQFFVTDGSFRGPAESAVITASTWYHVACVYNSAATAAEQLAIYVNGSLVANATGAGNLSSNYTATFDIGGSVNLPARDFTGTIANVRSHSAARTAAYIRANYLLQGPNAATYITAAEVATGTSTTLRRGKLSGIIGQPLRGRL